MDWFIKLFTREEKIAGLEVSDSYLRMALLQSKKVKAKDKATDKSEIQIDFLAEEPLASDVVVGGIVKNTTEFSKSVKKLLGKSPIKIKFVMVSIQADQVYSRIYSFPRTIAGEKLKESMDLTVGFQLPDKPENIYAGWQKVELSDQNEVLLATVPKKGINDLVAALDSTGLRVIAVEFNALSLCRAMDIKDGETVLVKLPQASGVAVFVIKNKLPYFARVLPKQFLSSQEMVDKEAERIAEFFSVDKGAVDRKIDISEGAMTDKVSGANQEVSGKWLISIGVAMRALVPRSADKMISLMSISTEDAYEYQKAVVFSEFILENLVALSIFFVAAFLIVLGSLSGSRESITTRYTSASTLQLPGNAYQLENEAQSLNGTLGVTTQILQSTVEWQTVLQQFNAIIIPGIIVNNVSFSPFSNGAGITFSGVAQNRTVLNNFTASMASSTFFTNVSIPLTNISQFTNISFSASMNIANPGNLYYAQ